jgi:hypothetical protein
LLAPRDEDVPCGFEGAAVGADVVCAEGEFAVFVDGEGCGGD